MILLTFCLNLKFFLFRIDITCNTLQLKCTKYMNFQELTSLVVPKQISDPMTIDSLTVIIEVSFAYYVPLCLKTRYNPGKPVVTSDTI